MTISINKILTCSANDWAKANNQELNRYDTIGIHYAGSYQNSIGEYVKALEVLARTAPENTEVIVDLRNFSNDISATALVPRSK